MTRWKRMICIIAAAGCVFGVTACGNKAEQQNSTKTEKQSDADTNKGIVGTKAKDFTVTLNTGEEFTLSENQDKIVLLNLWATWCPPCVKEMPGINKLYEEYGDEVIILGVDVGEEEQVVDDFVAENKISYPIGYDMNSEVIEKYPTDGIPYTVIIGTDGTIKKEFVGASSAEEQYEILKSAIEEVKGE